MDLAAVVSILFVSTPDTNEVVMARSLSKGLAPVVERLELDRPQIVTLRDIEKICVEEGVGTEPRVVASRLKKAGWLLPAGKRGAWEFAPAELAGPYSSCDPLLPVKVLVATSCDVLPILRGQTAAWALGLADRVPATVEVVIRGNTSATLSDGVCACAYRTNLDPVHAKGVLSLAPEAIVIQMVERPSSVRSWDSASEWLPDVMAEMNEGDMLKELEGKFTATAQRTGYLLQGVRPDLAEKIRENVRVNSVARFGQGKPKRYSARWKVVDSELSWNPEEMT